jgi:hypothetical protein
VEISISTFPGDAGGDAANVNRWRAQLGLAEVPASALGRVLVPLGGAKTTVRVMVASDAENTQRMLGAIIPYPPHAPTPLKTWFVKASGPAEHLAAIEEGFVEFLRSLRWAQGAPGGAMGGGMGGSPGMGAGQGAVPHLHFHTPPGWVEGPNTGTASRLLTMRAGDAELTVTRFAGNVGGELANLQRWEGQVGLPPSNSLSESAGMEVVVDGNRGTAWHLQGSSQSMLVASIPRDGWTYFYKLMGPRSSVSQEVENFASFLGSVSVDEGSHGAGHGGGQGGGHGGGHGGGEPGPGPQPGPTSRPSGGQPDPHGGMTPAGDPNGGTPQAEFTAPEDWVATPPSGNQTASFRVGQEQPARLSMTYWRGDVGGDLANLNMWRGQVGLNPVETAVPVELVTVGDHQGEVWDVSGEYKRILVTSVTAGGFLWFIKLEGPPPTVAAEEERYRAFLGTVRLQGGEQ